MYLREWSIVITMSGEAVLSIRATLLCPACNNEYPQEKGARKLTPEFAKHRRDMDYFWTLLSKEHHCPRCGTTGSVPLRFKEGFEHELDQTMTTDWLTDIKDRLHLVDGTGRGTNPGPNDTDFTYVSWEASLDTPKGELVVGPFRSG